jgi:(+)-trans-carveol dehydrogenase
LINGRFVIDAVVHAFNLTWDDFAEMSQSMHVLPTPWVEPDDVANLVAFLAPERARFIAGVAIPVDAGALLK